ERDIDARRARPWHASGLRLVALARPDKAGDRAVDSLDPHGAADRFHHSFLPGFPLAWSLRYDRGTCTDLSHLQSRAFHLDDAVVLRRGPENTRRGCMDRWLRDMGGILAHCPAAHGARARGDGSALLRVLVE